MSSETSTLDARIGSVSYVVSHLVTWIAHRRPGIVWVEFLSDEIRDRAIEQVNSTCRSAFIPVHRIATEAASTRRDWEQVRDQIEESAGVVHVLFPALFNQDLLDPRNFRDFAIALNLDRERVFSVSTSQIWWVSRPFYAIVGPFAPDFLSWVHARFTLNELPPFVAADRSSLEVLTDTDRQANASSTSLSRKSSEASPRVALDDPRLLEAHELLRQSRDLLTAGKLKEALACAGEAVYGFRQELSLGEAAQSALAASLDLLAIIQSRLGQRQQALASSAEAVSLHRALADANPNTFLPDLATSLNNQANMQRQMGQRAEALASIAEAVRLLRALADASPNALLPNLAMSLNNQAATQRDMGQRTEALASIAESVHDYRKLAETNPDAFLPNLATSLINQAATQSDMDQRAEALASIAEAASQFSALAEADPDAFLPHLAMSLNNQANIQSAMGQRVEALITIAEAVRHYRALAETNPNAFLPYLAASLNNQAAVESALGQPGSALASIAEAVRLRRALANSNASAFLPDLAMSLNNQAAMQSAMGQPAEALATIAEAVRNYRALAEGSPDAFLPNLARSLSNQANRQRDMGQRLEALASIAEAVRVRHALVKANPDAFLPDLAISLSVRGDLLAALERPLEARNAAREALTYLAPSFKRYPGVFDALAKTTLQDYLLRTQTLGEEPEAQLLSPYQGLLKAENPEAHRDREST